MAYSSAIMLWYLAGSVWLVVVVEVVLLVVVAVVDVEIANTSLYVNE